MVPHPQHSHGHEIEPREWEAIEEYAGTLFGHLDEQKLQVAEIVSLLKLATLQKPYDEIIALQPSPSARYFRTHGRRHNLIWSNGALVIQVDMGTGFSTVNLQNGWNVLDMPEGTAIQLASGATPTNIRYRCTDDDVSNLYHG